MFRSDLTCAACDCAVAFTPAFLGNIPTIILFSACSVLIGLQMSTWLDPLQATRNPLLRVPLDLLAACAYYLFCRLIYGLFQRASVCKEPADGTTLSR